MKLKKLLETFQKTDNENLAKLWRKCQPRLYKETNGWSDARIASAAMAYSCSSMSSIGNNCSFADKTITAAASQLCNFQVPTFFVEKEFAHAALQSTPSPDTVWAEMNLPFEAGIFMLPKDFIKHPTGNIPFVGFARLEPDKKYFIPNSPLWIKYDQKMFIIFTSFPEAVDFTSSVLMLSAADTPYINYEQSEISEEINGFFDDPMEESDNQLLQTLSKLTFSILCAMTARPELVESNGKKLSFLKKSKSELWTPNRIGRKYQIKHAAKNQSEEGTTITLKRAHWRRGHFRNQLYGVGLSETKMIWIEPTLIGARAK